MKDKNGFEFQPLSQVGGPVTRWVFGPVERHDYTEGSYISEDFGHIYNKRKELKAIVKAWREDNEVALS